MFMIVNLAIMAPLRCCTFNCRGWNSGVSTLKDHINSPDLCFIQEHWLLKDHLHVINDIFQSVLVGWIILPFLEATYMVAVPFSIGKPCLFSYSFRFFLIAFVVLKLLIHLSYWSVYLYLPAECLPSSFNEYLNTLGELQGFLESQQCDVNNYSDW